MTMNQTIFRDIVGNYADILFANANEARAFCKLPSTDSPMSATRYLSHSVPLVSVTDGVHGSYIGLKGEAIYIPPPPCIPVDTCGAGDAYTSGILYGILRGASDLKGIGLLASQVAAVVVGQQGTRLRVQDADRLAECFAHHLDSLEFCSDVWIWRCKHLIVSGLVQTLDIYMYIQSLPFLVGLVHLFKAGSRAGAGKGLPAHLVPLTIIAHNWKQTDFIGHGKYSGIVHVFFCVQMDWMNATQWARLWNCGIAIRPCWIGFDLVGSNIAIACERLLYILSLGFSTGWFT